MSEYPFYARWYVNRVLATDITSVDYVVEEYNPSTDSFDDIQTGTINTEDDKGRWIAPFDVPDVAGFKQYSITYTPNGGDHVTLSEKIDAFDGRLDAGNQDGAGTETHSGTVCDNNGDALQGVLVRAVPFGTTKSYATDLTDVNGNYTLEGLVVDHAYELHYNLAGFWSKQSGLVIP